jgi:hypothetical protein
VKFGEETSAERGRGTRLPPRGTCAPERPRDPQPRRVWSSSPWLVSAASRRPGAMPTFVGEERQSRAVRQWREKGKRKGEDKSSTSRG